MQTPSERPRAGGTNGDEPVQGINNQVIGNVSQILEHEIETSGNHLYDEPMNYKDQANQRDNASNQIRRKPSNTEPEVQVEETDQMRATKEREESGLHTYAVLEEAIPPVPERYI